MDRILIILKKENGPICPCTRVKYHNIPTCLLVYAADSGERLQDHWSSGFLKNKGSIVLKAKIHLHTCTEGVFIFSLICRRGTYIRLGIPRGTHFRSRYAKRNEYGNN